MWAVYRNRFTSNFSQRLNMITILGTLKYYKSSHFFFSFDALIRASLTQRQADLYLMSNSGHYNITCHSTFSFVPSYTEHCEAWTEDRLASIFRLLSRLHEPPLWRECAYRLYQFYPRNKRNRLTAYKTHNGPVLGFWETLKLDLEFHHNDLRELH